jgi:hypothetical protein
MKRRFRRRQFLRRAVTTVAATVLPTGIGYGVQRGSSKLEVEAEEDVYAFTPASNGADPMWAYGSTCLVRIGDDVFVSGLETVTDASPMDNCRWKIFRRSASGWRPWFTDAVGRTREPAPIAAFPRGPLFLSANPTIGRGAEPSGGSTRPEVVEFDPSGDPHKNKRLLPEWSGKPPFTQYSYRSFAADGVNRHLVVFQNIALTHAEWAFRDETGRWSAQGRLDWPWGADYETPQRIRVCYPNVALTNRAVHFCGVSDIVEPNKRWRDFKRRLSGQEWDYDLRRLFYTWCPRIGQAGFHQWTEIASCEEFGGRILPGDLWVASDGTVHLLWTERMLDARLRPFFPQAKQTFSLRYALLREGKVVSRSTIAESVEGHTYESPWAARFHVWAPDRLFAVWHVAGTSAQGKPISENRLIELRGGKAVGAARSIPLRTPFVRFFTATPRAGSPPSPLLEMLGQRLGSNNLIEYARIRLT